MFNPRFSEPGEPGNLWLGFFPGLLACDWLVGLGVSIVKTWEEWTVCNRGR
jgi:hypothetical protein